MSASTHLYSVSEQLTDLLPFPLHPLKQRLLRPLKLPPVLGSPSELQPLHQLVLLSDKHTDTRQSLWANLEADRATYRVISRSSFWNACRSSDSSSPLAEDDDDDDDEEVEEDEERSGWCRFRSDSTDWTLARTEWLQPAD